MSGNQIAISNQVNIEAARVGFRAAFMQSLATSEADPIEQLFMTVGSTGSIEEWEWLGDLPGFTEWKGDRLMSELSGFKIRVANRDWSDGLRVHQNQFKDDKLGMFSASIPELARAAKQHRYDLIAQLLLNGFDGTAFPDAGNGLAYDGAFVFSDSHVVDGGPAQSNLLSSVALSFDGLSQAEAKLKRMKTADGRRPLNLKGTHLVVGPALETLALKLVNAETLATTAGTASESNIFRNRYKVIVSPRIDGAQANHWFLGDLSRAIKPFLFQLREEITTSAIVGGAGGADSVPRFKRGEYWFGAEARYAAAAFAWQMIVGSND